MNNIGFKLYLLFIGSWFLHLPARIPALGTIRFDMLLVLLILTIIFLDKKEENKHPNINKPGTVIKILLLYSIATLPFVEWPGSVLHTGIINFIKAIVFYYFTVILITTEHRLKIFLGVFLACQSYRILEPVYLHVTEGYWGSVAHMGGSDFMNRLSGAPYDIVNPNGLAFIIVTVIPFFHYLSSTSIKNKILYYALLPLFLYALALTGSRSGFLALIVILIGIARDTQKKVLVIGLIALSVSIAFLNLSSEQRDRYVSIFDTSAKHYATASGRTDEVIDALRVALRKPIFGHGLGTSREANANFGIKDIPAHNLYAEVAQELGFLGLVIYLFYIRSIIRNFHQSVKQGSMKENVFLHSFNKAGRTWLWMNILFSFASYGLSSYEWYLFGGLSVVSLKLFKKGNGE